jgi:pimeloyl-ACP methyl ester carboxylesterase
MNASLASKLSHAAALTQSCVDRAVRHNSSIAYHLNTTPLAEDMVAITERHGEWREKTAAALLGVDAHELRRRTLHPRPVESSNDLTTSWQRTKLNVGKEKLLYWGVSYGAVPGQLFAHMHPDSVFRVLLDGVVDVDVYLGSKWDAPIAQGDDILEYFFSSCSRSPSCKFGDGDEERARARYEKLLQSLSNQPLPVPSNTEPTISADTITSSDVRRLVRQVTYTPLKLFSRLDRILVDLENGNGTAMAADKQSKLRPRETHTAWAMRAKGGFWDWLPRPVRH